MREDSSDRLEYVVSCARRVDVRKRCTVTRGIAGALMLRPLPRDGDISSPRHASDAVAYSKSAIAMILAGWIASRRKGARDDLFRVCIEVGRDAMTFRNDRGQKVHGIGDAANSS